MDEATKCAVGSSSWAAASKLVACRGQMLLTASTGGGGGGGGCAVFLEVQTWQINYSCKAGVALWAASDGVSDTFDLASRLLIAREGGGGVWGGGGGGGGALKHFNLNH